MRYRLDLVLRPVEGALVRVIGMTERRGFAPCAISGGSEDGDGRWRLQLVVDGSRPAETLKRQLQKVYDCESVAIVPVETAPFEGAARDDATPRHAPQVAA
ncbi:ACT domain-containing protein [Pseudoxanthomonas koreensis]|uniref:ACT domain-containing protein n=1 Tax=Pseudoxanthomonas koreensis TaxID=266061 RepID=UPI0013911CCF|nr:ACT domain-containing protein [Pseudoxanthomonas koreensis]KAF1691314.1 acetolactate synthase [Pseudoxanthomonas koreensis]